jgi:transposase-like protein
MDMVKNSNCDYAIAYVNAGVEELKILKDKNLIDKPAKQTIKELIKELNELVKEETVGVYQSGTIITKMNCDTCKNPLLLKLWMDKGEPKITFKCVTCHTEWTETNKEAIENYPELTAQKIKDKLIR